MRVLFVGDVVGRPGRNIIGGRLDLLKEREKIDLAIVNAENAAGGSGLTPRIAEELFSSGADVLTSGDHIWKKREIYEFLNSSDKVTRPLNYPEGAPGKGVLIIKTPTGKKVGIINVIGRVFMDAVECPFRSAKKALSDLKEVTPIIIVDIHAEATSEKVAMGWYLDGEVSAVVGTHTHIQTADEKILPEGTAYITDCGMTGPYDSVIGRKKDKILARFLTQLPAPFDMATDDVQMHGVIIDIDEKTGKAHEIKRVQEKM